MLKDGTAAGDLISGSGVQAIQNLVREQGPLAAFVELFNRMQEDGLLTGEQMSSIFADINQAREGGADALQALESSLRSVGGSKKIGGFSEVLGAIFSDSKGLLAVLDLIGPSMQTNLGIMDAMEDTSGATAKAFEVMSGTQQFGEDAATAQMKALMVSIGSVATPIVTKALKTVTESAR